MTPFPGGCMGAGREFSLGGWSGAKRTSQRPQKIGSPLSAFGRGGHLCDDPVITKHSSI